MRSSVSFPARRTISRCFAPEVPGLYFILGIVPRSQDISKAAPNHSPDFFIDESALVVGVRALAMMTVNYLTVTSD